MSVEISSSITLINFRPTVVYLKESDDLDEVYWVSSDWSSGWSSYSPIKGSGLAQSAP